MYEAVMIAATGLQNQQRRLDTIANNVSNVNTTAYKNSRLDFKDALYTAGLVPARPRTPEPEGNQQKGHGVMVAGITKDYKQGSVIRTDRDLDLAIEGEGFFALEDTDGNTIYTRNGCFNLSVEIDGVFLVNGNGLYVRDENDERIQVPEFADSISVSENGVIVFSSEDEETTVTLGIYTFRNLMGLMSAGEGNYSESVASGERLPATEAKIMQGVTEASNVNLAEEMTRMIRTQRAFSLSSRALRTADDMEGIANNMRR